MTAGIAHPSKNDKACMSHKPPICVLLGHAMECLVHVGGVFDRCIVLFQYC